MWIITSYGILMPAEIPSSVYLDPAHDATWDLQVRSRDRKTLQRAIKRMRVYAKTARSSPLPRSTTSTASTATAVTSRT